MVAKATISEQPSWRVKRVENLAENLIDVWWCVGGQMRMFLAALCTEIEKLHNDMSYILIEGQK